MIAFSGIGTWIVQRASSAQGASNPGGKSHGTPPTSLATRSATMFSKSSSVGGAKRNKDKRRSSRGKAERDSNPQTLAVTPTTTTPTTQWYMASPLPADTDRITWAVGTPVFELRQENGPTKNGTCLSLARGQLTPKRPLRSEVERERRLSRPSCGQFPPTRLSSTGANTTTARFNGSSSNRDSIGHCGRHVGTCSPARRPNWCFRSTTLTLNDPELLPVHTVADPGVVIHRVNLQHVSRTRPTLQSQDCPVTWTTDSTASEEDGAPPPLPQKTREADYCNLPDDAERESESIRAPATPRIRNKVSRVHVTCTPLSPLDRNPVGLFQPPPPPEPLEGPTPPHPPPKKPPLKPSTS
uniref:Uncharacterized protein n=1 Tax=Timema douglasi TaxID=61478 RepID=A0A7R8VKR6_TIMDO|nr:unnamed protein product [Timema douglasi]